MRENGAIRADVLHEMLVRYTHESRKIPENVPVNEVYPIHESRVVQRHVKYVVMHAAVPSGLAATHCFAPRGQPHRLCALLWSRRRAGKVMRIGVDEVVVVNSFKCTGFIACDLILGPNN